MPPTTTHDDAHYATVRELSAFTGIGQAGIRKSYLPLLPQDAVQPGKPKRYRSRDVIEIMIQRRAESLTQAADCRW